MTMEMMKLSNIIDSLNVSVTEDYGENTDTNEAIVTFDDHIMPKRFLAWTGYVALKPAEKI